jgi:phage tail sheath protein FI
MDDQVNPPYPGIYIEETSLASRVIESVPTSITAFLGRALTGPSIADGNAPVAISSFQDYEQIFGSLSVDRPMSYAVRDFFLNGGGQAVIVRLVEKNGSDPSDDSKLSAETYIDDGVAALEKVDLFNILCVPPDSFDPQAPERDVDNSVYLALAVYCAKRRAMLILDSPTVWTEYAGKNSFENIQPSFFGIEGETQRNAAVYFPRVIEADLMRNNSPTVMPACGMVAGNYAGNDSARGVWKAPAGMNAGLSGILGLEINLTDAQNNLLNSLGINCLRSFPITGPLVWGARTLRGADVLQDDYKYISIRRLGLFLEESIDRGTRWAEFEPNDESLWSIIRDSVSTFLADLQKQGAFYSYFVRCDNSTMTQDDIERGILNIMVGFAPLEPAEFIVFQITQCAAQPKI